MTETCSCGTLLTVMGSMRDGSPVTRCRHCDQPCVGRFECEKCDAYDKHQIRSR